MLYSPLDDGLQARLAQVLQVIYEKIELFFGIGFVCAVCAGEMGADTFEFEPLQAGNGQGFFKGICGDRC